MKKIILFLCTSLIFYGVLNTTNGTRKLIPDEAIRLRVIPNSNSSYDQEIKGLVKEELRESMEELLKDTKGIDQARMVIVKNLPTIDAKVANVLKRENYSLGYTLDYGMHSFPEKTFGGISYEAGVYESLLITLGKGEGDNWWCVLFPPLCLLEAEESDSVEYKFFLQELIEKYL